MMTILLYGFLGKRFGKVHKYAVKTPAEAVKALCATIKGFKEAVINGGSYKVLSGGVVSLEVERLVEPHSIKKTLRIVPVVEGSGRVFNTILGVVLIIVGVWTGYANLVTAGVSLLFVTAIQAIFAPGAAVGPGDRESPYNRPSFAFDGAVNTIGQGHPIPICYGKMIVGSQIISAGLTVDQG